MSIADAYRSAVDAVQYSRDDLIIVLRVALTLISSLPSSDELVELQRQERQLRRAAGEEVDIDVDEEDDEDGGSGSAADEIHTHHVSSGRDGADDDASEAPHDDDQPVRSSGSDSMLSSELLRVSTPMPTVEEEEEEAHTDMPVDADADATPAAQHLSSCSSTDFVSPASLHSGHPLLRSTTASEASGDVSGRSYSASASGRRSQQGGVVEGRARSTPDGAPHGEAWSRSGSDTAAVSIMRERVRQLRMFDEDMEAWLIHVILCGASHFGGLMEYYFSSMHTLHCYMAARRKRVEQRSEYLRARLRGDAPPPHPSPTAPVCEAPLAAEAAQRREDEDGATSDEEDSDEEDEAGLEGFHISSATRREMHVPLPDSAMRLRDTVHNFFFSCYASVTLHITVNMTVARRIVAEVIRINEAVLTWPRHPLQLRQQWTNDRKSQFHQFVTKWINDGDGRLSAIMRVPRTAPARAPARHGDDSTSSDFSSAGSDEPPGGTPSERGLPSSVNDDDGGDGAQDAADEDLGPQTSHADIVALTHEYMHSTRPSSTPLALLVADTVPGKGVDALQPCIVQPERTGFNAGFCRLTPWMSEAEQALIEESLQLPLSEVPEAVVAGGVSRRRALKAAEVALMLQWASPTYDPRGGELTVLLNPTSAFRLQLCNPIFFSLGGVQCDMCCATERRVSFQAVLDTGVRSEVVLECEGCVGYDVCVACAYFYYKSSTMRLLRSVHPDATVRRAFTYGRYSMALVHSLRAYTDAAPTDAGVVDLDMMVEVVMGVSPYGVVPVGWHLSSDALSTLRATCPTVGEETEMTVAVHAALPTPPREWKSACSVSNISKLMSDAEEEGGGAVVAAAAAASGDTLGQGLVAGTAGQHAIDEADVCPICLQLLHSPLPVLCTRCGHWFHVECIGSHYYYKPAVVNGELNEENGCPVCRSPDYMPSLTDAEAMLRTNTYRLLLRVPAAEVARAGAGGCAVAVGTILTDDGVYRNATNIAACTSFHGLVPGYRYCATATDKPIAAAPGAHEEKKGE
ncbi:Ring finger domain containing protein [Novymonas esmeraldas]|uniref:Ring finger domain containing protein n=1 Tax=Novymonas esmeraldas TaxID=1808958 RepID=A0AAW0EM27_9TRYP